uniref:Si:dkey-190l8.2 n=1 Tax=Sinocyclocheilus anshuiensis TaxID=1608454 RepID=A0A671N0J7_9TELE
MWIQPRPPGSLFCSDSEGLLGETKTDNAFRRFVGPLQRHVYIILTLPIFFTAFTFFVDVFTLHITPCSDNIASNELHTVSVLQQSLTCHEANRFAHGQATYTTGLLLGSLIGGAVSDKYGKKLLLICCSAVLAVATLVVAFLPYVPVYLTARGISGVACCAIHICTYSLGRSWSLPKYRIWPPTLFSFIFSLGMMGLAAVAVLASGWMQFHLALVEQTQIFSACFLPESPRWLLLNKRMKTLEGYQNRSPENKHYLGLVRHNSNFANFTSPNILLHLFVMSYIGFASALTYYGICFSVGSFGVNIYLAQFFSGLSEAPSLLLPFLLKRWGRRPFSMGSLFLSGISCMLSLLVSKFCDLPALVMTLALMGKLCMQSTYCVSVLYGIELFPTVIRQKCVGLVSLCYRVACIINVVVTPDSGIRLPAMICYSSGPIIGAALCLLLPETSGIPLPDTVQDCEKQLRIKLSCCDNMSDLCCKLVCGTASDVKLISKRHAMTAFFSSACHLYHYIYI